MIAPIKEARCRTRLSDGERTILKHFVSSVNRSRDEEEAENWRSLT